MKKIFVLILAVLAACFVLAGCDDTDPPEKRTFTVTFDSQGGSAVESQQVAEDDTVKRPQNPWRDGYFLNGWYASSATTADTQWHFEIDRVTESITLYAGWTVETSQEEITEMYITVGGNKLTVTLDKNPAVDALVEILKQGDICYTANDYGGFEKVGSLDRTLPTSNSQITTEPGDVILYAGNQIVLFYGSNSWSYTRLGKINGYSATELATLLGAGKGSVQVTISLS